LPDPARWRVLGPLSAVLSAARCATRQSRYNSHQSRANPARTR